MGPDDLKTRRKQAKFSQRALAEKAGVAHSLISTLENGYEPKPPTPAMERVAIAVGASVGSFWG